ncbi:MAG: hypothetical protein FJ191_10265 [Gammaproteobacteria bacterium]|nr:hypothetical protein [Gammaproteobacteria bacterium]
MSRMRVLLPVAGLLLAIAGGSQAGQPPDINYQVHCQGCHVPDGSGIPPEVPSLVADMGRFLHVDGGRAYLVQVPGTANSPLDNAEVATLLNWMLVTYARHDLPADFRPYTAAEVARYRAERLLDPAARRGVLLAQLGSGGRPER